MAGRPPPRPPLGFLVTGQARTWFAGDTDLDDGVLDAVGTCDVALVPVGGWGPGLGAGHLDPHRAAQAVARVGARDAVPIHWGTLRPRGLGRVGPQEFLGPGRAFVERCTELAQSTTPHLLTPGQTVQL